MIGLVWAQAANGVIGRDNAIPWRLPEDMAHFRTLTLGATVVMGRRTWESLPARFRPLPERRNIVLSRDRGWADAGAEVVSDLSSALQSTTAGDVWVIGGAQIYEAALPFADRVVVTELADAFEGDRWAPALGPEWEARTTQPTEPADGWIESSGGLSFRTVTYERRGVRPDRG